jgi:hypothetical protein
MAQARYKFNQSSFTTGVLTPDEGSGVLFEIFNPQVGVYYGTMLAHVYDGKGKYINKYAGESKVQGSFFFSRLENITESYRAAMGDLITKLKADNALTETIAADVASGDELASCSQVPNLPANLPTSGLKK